VRRLAVALALLTTALLASTLAPAVASAAGNPPGAPAPQSAPPGTPVLITSYTKPPPGYRLTGAEVKRIGSSNPWVIAALRGHPKWVPYVYTRGSGVWQVSWFTPLPGVQREMIQIYVDDATGKVTQVWTGYQVAWTMARGYPGAFGKNVNSLYVWLPMCFAFVLPFLPWRRRPTLLHLDLLMLLGFSISLAFFNQAKLGLSVPLVYPFMGYLMVRMLLLAFGRGRPREPLRVLVPTSWLAIGVIFLIGFRIGLNVTNSNVIDVGYAGVIGADKVLHDQPLYGHWPSDNPAGDTYGPINYYAYIPFNLIFGWSGTWDSLPAAHAAAITFDVLTMLGLFILGWTIRGPTLATVLAYLWAAYPFTLFALSSNSNDTLVALWLVVALLVLRWAVARGVVGAFAGLTKFAPLALAPLLLRGVGPLPSLRTAIRICLAYGAAIVAAMAYVLLDGNIAWLWRDSISYQANRPAPFSIWGLWGGRAMSLKIPQHLWQGVVVALGLAVVVVPRGRRSIVQVAALGAAIIIGLEMGITYWFYMYIVWFFPLVIVALAAAHPPEPGDMRPLPAVRWRRREQRVPAPV
jgi:hypothetical protein